VDDRTWRTDDHGRFPADVATHQRRERPRLSGTPAHVATRLRLQIANESHDTRALQLYLGHKDIRHTARYSELSSAAFNGFWKD
jgi:hypothetical protein